MVTKRRVMNAGVQLDSLDDRIIIQGIDVQAGKEQINTVSLWGGTGSRVTGVHRDSLDIVIRFGIRLKSNRSSQLEARQEIFDKITSWALASGWLRVNTKPDRRIRAIVTQLPSEGDATEWNADYSITFRAYGVPYWQDITPAGIGMTSVRNTTTKILIGGTIETVADVSFRNTSGSTISTFTVKAGSNTIKLTGLGLANGETLSIDHADNGRRSMLRIRIQSTAGKWRSVLDTRTAGSADDLYVEPGLQSFVVQAGGAGTLDISVAGRYA